MTSATTSNISPWTSVHQTFHDQQAFSSDIENSSPTESFQSDPSPISGPGMSHSPDTTLYDHPAQPKASRQEVNDDIEMGSGRRVSEHNCSQKARNDHRRVPFRKFELGKITMAVVAPTTTLLVCLKVWAYSSPVAAIPLLLLWYGSLSIILGVAMSHSFPSAARWIEEAGVMLVFGAFTWSMSSMFYPRLYLMVVPVLCFPVVFIALVVLRYVDSGPGGCKQT